MKIRLPWWAVLLFIVGWGIMMASMFELWPTGRPEGEWATITNEQFDFTVGYPTKWRAETYDESGYRGAKDIKLRIYRSTLGGFEITVRYQKAVNPTLDNVKSWGDKRIKEANRNRANNGLPTYEIFEVQEDILNGTPITRTIYGNEEIMNQDIHIARSNNMIIIRLQSEAYLYEDRLDDFEQIVQSFEPLE